MFSWERCKKVTSKFVIYIFFVITMSKMVRFTFCRIVAIQYILPKIPSQASSVHRNKQELLNSQFMETVSSCKEPWPRTQLIQPALTSEGVSTRNLADNTFQDNFFIRHNQEIKPEYHSENGLALYENWNRQSNFLRCANQNMQTSSIGRESSNLAPYLNG